MMSEQMSEDELIWKLTDRFQKILKPFGLSGRVEMAFFDNEAFKVSFEPRGCAEDSIIHLIDLYPCGRIRGEFFSNCHTGESQLEIEAKNEADFIFQIEKRCHIMVMYM